MKTALIVLAILCGTNAIADPIQWSQGVGGNGNYYEHVTGSMTWNEAFDAANALTWMGAPGHLVVVTSAEENAWIWSSLAEPRAAWLGALQSANASSPSTGWSWVTGVTWGFTNWWPGEPNDAGTGNEWAIEFAPNGTWNDVDGSLRNQAGMIVEYELTAVPGERTTWGATKALFR